MRELKFRVYQLDYKEMEHFTLSNAEQYCADGPIMQFTGLKDKNGVEIYEGDIIIDEEDLVFFVEYNESEAVFDGQNIDKNDTFQKSHLHSWPYNGWKIIGNIHQNPELLTKGE